MTIGEIKPGESFKLSELGQRFIVLEHIPGRQPFAARTRCGSYNERMKCPEETGFASHLLAIPIASEEAEGNPATSPESPSAGPVPPDIV